MESSCLVILPVLLIQVRIEISTYSGVLDGIRVGFLRLSSSDWQIRNGIVFVTIVASLLLLMFWGRSRLVIWPYLLLSFAIVVLFAGWDLTGDYYLWEVVGKPVSGVLNVVSLFLVLQELRFVSNRVLYVSLSLILLSPLLMMEVLVYFVGGVGNDQMGLPLSVSNYSCFLLELVVFCQTTC